MQSIEINNTLKQYGLLCHTFFYNDLPAHIQQTLSNDRRIHYADSYLSLLANAGPVFWARLKAGEFATDAVDRFSESIAMELVECANLSQHAKILYPGDGPAPLIQLGELAQWSTPSPLGLGLHKKYGPWLAYRALIKTSAPLTEVQAITKRNEIVSPCLSCETTPCVKQCPAQAVSLDRSFNIDKCATHRMLEHSACKEQCHARNACPVGKEFIYSKEQRAYHMTHALEALVRWAAK